VDGVATDHRKLEGFLLPLPWIEARIFNPQWWAKHHNRRMDGDEAAWGRACDEIEAALAKVLVPDGLVRELRVIRDADSCEAWVNVAFSFNDRGIDGRDEGCARVDGVLTWENCD
jgi:hypothetical protein